MSEAGHDDGVDWARVRELFEAACERVEDERVAFVTTGAAGDHALRDEVLELLRAADQSRDRIASPSSAWRPGASGGGSPIGPGSAVGPYTLERTLASGGMGVVFLARREDPRRTVALKMIQLGYDEEASVRRFRTEVSVLAALTHPGIAQVYESGVHVDGPRSLPWFAMEYVERARTILDDARERRLGDGDRVDLVRQVLAAVAHGHAKGVVHRDLKPDNILVDESGRAKVIDFGVARATGADVRASTALTRTGTILGTLAYMSPEQLSGRPDQVDARTDVYALGVVLYELLCGAHPFELERLSLPEAARRVTETAPRRPSAMRKDVPRDLETIVSKALEREPERRYESATAFARDLERWREHEPIEARPPSVTYQARLFARRHRAFVGAMLAITVVSIAAAVYSFRKSVAARDAEALANRRFTEGRRLARDLLEDGFEELLGVKGATRAKSALARVALSYLDGLADEAALDLSLGEELVRGYLRMGDVLGAPRFSSLGRSDRALESYAQALRLTDRLRASFAGEPSLELLGARAHLLHGRVALSSGLNDVALRDVTAGLEALRELPAAIAEQFDAAHQEASLLVLRGDLQRKSLASDAAERDYSRALARLVPFDHPNAWRTTAFVLERLARGEKSRGDLDRAAALYERQFELLESLLGPEPEEVEGRLDLHTALGAWGVVQNSRGLHAEALSLFERSLALVLPVASEDPDDVTAWADVGWSFEWIGSAKRGLGEFESSAASFTRGAEIAERLRDRDPDRLEWRWSGARRRVGAALAYLRLGRADEALVDAQSAFAAMQEGCRLDPDDAAGRRDLCWAAGILFQILYEVGRHGDAIAVLDSSRAVAIRHLEIAPDDAEMCRHVVVFDDQLGIAWRAIGDDAARSNEARRAAYDTAISAFERSRAGLERLLARGQAMKGDEAVLPQLPIFIAACEAARNALGEE